MGRKDEISRVLAVSVRVLSVEQVARTWWSDSDSGRRESRRALCALEGAGVVQRVRALVHPELPLVRAVVEWKPGDETPAFGTVAYQLQTRWREALRPATLYVATPKVTRRFASRGKGRIERPLQLTHDLHVSAIYLNLLLTQPTAARAWISEDTLAAERKHQKLPDAILRGLPGSPDVVIEFGGAYRRERVELVHEDCVRRELPYQLW
jgi:hypothetical protein